MLNNTENKIIEGIYLVENKFDKIWLENKNNQVKQAVDYDKFHVFLLQSFSIDAVNKITEAVMSEKKLIIDFDKGVVKLIEQKEEPFINFMKTYMNPQSAEQWKDDQENLSNTSYPYWF